MMPTFNDLYKKAHVKSHSLFAGMEDRVGAMRTNMKREAKGVDLEDIFAERKNVGLQSGDRTLNAFVQEAALVARSALDVLDFPLRPTLTYNNARNVRVAAHDDTQVVNAEILFNVRIATTSGVIRQAVLPVHITSGAVVPPSILHHEGRNRILSQDTVDSIIERNTSYALQPLRPMFSSPLVGEDLERAVDERNETGYQAREVPTDATGLRRTYGKDAQLWAPATEEPVGIYFEEGDTILFDEGDGQYSVARVTQRIADFQGGRPGFRGVDPRTGLEVYGFEDSVMDVIQAGEKEVQIAHKHVPESERLMAKMDERTSRWYKVYLSEGDSPRTAFVKALELARKDALFGWGDPKVSPRDVKKTIKTTMPSAIEQAVQTALPQAIAPQVQESISQAFPSSSAVESFGGFSDAPTQQAFQTISGNDKNYQRAGIIAASSPSPEAFAQSLEGEQSFWQDESGTLTVPQEEIAAVNWQEVADMLLSTPYASLSQYKGSTMKLAQDDTQDDTQVGVPNPNLGGSDIGQDPTLISQTGPTPMVIPASPQNQISSAPTEELYRQITANPFIVEQVAAAINPKEAEVVDNVYAAVQPLLATFNIQQDQVEWYDLVNDLRDYISGSAAVTGEVQRKMGLVLAEYLSGRRHFGKRRASVSVEEDAVDLSLYLQASAPTFEEEKYHYNDQLVVEALDALHSGDERTASTLLSGVKSLFVDKAEEIPAAEWDEFVAAQKKMGSDEDEQEGEGSDVPDPQRFTPPGYDLVLGDMVEAEDQGLDTFPRSYSHVEKNYILRRLPTCSYDAWYKNLVNDGFVLNQWGPNRGRPGRQASAEAAE